MILIVSLIIFLVTLYSLSVDDFIFMRKNVSLVSLFDMAFIACVIGLFFARLAYAFIHPSFAYFNPLVFFIIPYFPGLSFPGFVVGTLVAVYDLSLRQKMPTGRIFDIFSLAFVPSIALFVLWQGVLGGLQRHFLQAVSYGISFILLISLFLMYKNIFTKSVWKDGSVASLLLSSITLLFGLLLFVGQGIKTIPSELFIFLFLLCMLFFSFLFRKFRRGERE